jgi:hypothetical protein
MSNKTYKIEYEKFNGVSSNIIKNKGNWKTNLDGVFQLLKGFENNSSFSGSAANSTCEYIETVHRKIEKNLITLIQLHAGNFELFYNDFLRIESDKFGRIESNEINTIKSDIIGYKKKVSEINSNINVFLRLISDIFQPVNKCTSDAEAIMRIQDEIVKYIDDINDAVGILDKSHSNSDFTNTKALMKALKSLINQCIEKDRTFKANFSISSIYELGAWDSVNKAGIKAEMDYTLKEIAINEAEKNSANIKNEISAYKKREKEANRWKLLITGACVVLTALMVVATAGAGTGIVIAAMAATGGFTSGAEKSIELMTDEYVEKGNLNDLDRDEYTKKVVIAGLTGAASGAFDAATGGASSKVTKKIGEKIIKSTVEEVVSGGVERIVESAAENISDIADGKTDFRTAVHDTGVDTFDMEEIGKDAVKGSIKAVTGEVTSGVAKKKGLDAKYLNSSDTTTKTISNAVKKSGDSVISGGSKRFVNKLIDGYGVTEATENAFDGESMMSDALSGAGKGASKSVKDDIESDLKKNSETKSSKKAK